MNNVNLSGRFTADPVIRYSKSNYAFASFTLAVDRYSHRDGEPSTDFIDCYAIGRTAEHIEKYFFRGMRAEITGQIQTSTFKNRNEQSIKSTRVFVEKIQFGESKAASDSFRGAAHYDNPVDSSSSNQHSASQVPNNQQSRSRFPSHNNGAAVRKTICQQEIRRIMPVSFQLIRLPTTSRHCSSHPLQMTMGL